MDTMTIIFNVSFAYYSAVSAYTCIIIQFDVQYVCRCELTIAFAFKCPFIWSSTISTSLWKTKFGECDSSSDVYKICSQFWANFRHDRMTICLYYMYHDNMFLVICCIKTAVNFFLLFVTIIILYNNTRPLELPGYSEYSLIPLFIDIPATSQSATPQMGFTHSTHVANRTQVTTRLPDCPLLG